MKLGILVTTDKYREQIKGLVDAAITKGHEVEMFVMDEGTRLLEERSFLQLISLDHVEMSYCSYNLENLGVSKDKITENIVKGTQYQNACMVHDADKVIVL